MYSACGMDMRLQDGGDYMGKIILTGDRPTGRLHIGHYVGSLKRRVELQNSRSEERRVGKECRSRWSPYH